MDSQEAYAIVINTGVSNLKLEEIISKSNRYSYYYASFLKRRFSLGEKSISQDSNYSYYYADEIIKGRFELGEETISKDVYFSCFYAKDVLKGRFRLSENFMIKPGQKLYCHIVLGYNHD